MYASTSRGTRCSHVVQRRPRDRLADLGARDRAAAPARGAPVRDDAGAPERRAAARCSAMRSKRCHFGRSREDVRADRAAAATSSGASREVLERAQRPALAAELSLDRRDRDARDPARSRARTSPARSSYGASSLANGCWYTGTTRTSSTGAVESTYTDREHVRDVRRVEAPAEDAPRGAGRPCPRSAVSHLAPAS